MNPTKNSDPKHKYMLAGVGTNNEYVILRRDGKYFKESRYDNAAGRFSLACAGIWLGTGRLDNYAPDYWTEHLTEPAPTYKYVPHPNKPDENVIQREDGKVFAYSDTVQVFSSKGSTVPFSKYVLGSKHESWVDMPEKVVTLTLTVEQAKLLTAVLGPITVPGYATQIYKVYQKLGEAVGYWHLPLALNANLRFGPGKLTHA